MIKSSDGLWNVSVIDNISSAVLPAADFSVFSVGPDTEHAAGLMRQIENMPAAAHLSLIIPRAPKGDLRDAFASVSSTMKMNLLSVISLTYDKPIKYSSIILSPISETGFLVYKGPKPEISNTGWFQGESAKDRGENATTHWDLTRYVTGKLAVEPAQQTTLGRFSWDLGLLLASLSEAPRYNRFVYGLDPNDENLMSFVKSFDIECFTFATTMDAATKLITAYEKVKNPAEGQKK